MTPWLKNLALRYLFNAVTVDDIVTFEARGPKYVVKVNGITLTGQELGSLREEARYIQNTRVWKLITSTLGEDARKRMFEKSLTVEDMTAGKMVIYAVDMQNKIIDLIGNKSTFDTK